MDARDSHECAGGNLKHIQSTGDTSGTTNTHSGSCHHDDKSKVLNAHTERPQWNSSWFRAQPILLVVPIMLGIIFFPRFHLPPFRFQQHFLESGFSGLLACMYRGMMGNGTALSTPITTAFSSNGRTNMVQWDTYTLALQGQRVLV
jgi:hypothetical protein